MEINNKNVGNENAKKAADRLYEYIMSRSVNRIGHTRFP